MLFDYFLKQKNFLVETISAFELINRMGIHFFRETKLALNFPFSNIPEWMVLLDIGHPGKFSTKENTNEFFENILTSGACGLMVFSLKM